MMMHDIRFKFFNAISTISADDYSLFVDALTLKQFKKGDCIVEPDQIQQHLYFVNSGVWMSHAEHEEKSVVMAFAYAPGPCAVPDSFLLQQPSQYYLTCMGDSETVFISYVALNNLFEQSQPLERLFRKMTEVVLSGMISRHTELHTLSIEERFVQFCRRSPHLLQLIPHKYLAAYLGMNPTNFSKLFNRVKI
jgi:CRP-like cAMP-binding protein